MVLTVAALMFQLASPVQPLFHAALTQPALDTPHPAPAATAPADPITSPSGETHLNLDGVTLDGNSQRSSAPQLTAASLAESHNSESLADIRIPEPSLVKPVKVPAAETRPSTRSWLMLALAQHGAASFDAYTTRQAIGRGAVEMDPLMRPFAHSDGLYAAIQVGPVLLDLLAHRMQRSERPLARRMWWVPQSVSTAGFLFCGVHNLGVSGRR